MENKVLCHYCAGLTMLIICLAYWKIDFNNIQSLKEFVPKTSFCNAKAENVIIVGNSSFVLSRKTKAYELDGKPIIWIFWDRESIKVYIRLLIESMKCVNKEFHVIVVHETNVRDYWPGCPWYFSNLIPAHKSDMFRIHILRIFGGIYIDADTYALHTFKEWYDLLTDYDLVSVNWRGELLSSIDPPNHNPLSFGHIGPARANQRFFVEWGDEQLRRGKAFVTGEPYPFDWTYLGLSIGYPLIKKLLKENAIKYYEIDGGFTTGQVILKDLGSNMLKPLDKVQPPLYNINATPILYSFHHGQTAKLSALTFDDFLPSTANDTVFSYFVKCALKTCYSGRKFQETKRMLLTEGTNLNVSKLIEVANGPIIYKCYNFENYTIQPRYGIM